MLEVQGSSPCPAGKDELSAVTAEREAGGRNGVAVPAVTVSLDESTVSLSKVLSAAPQCVQFATALRTWVPHLGQTVTASGDGNLERTGTRWIHVLMSKFPL